MVLPIKKTIIYGPVNSRRLGKSQGINLMPYSKKLCDFDCLYCHYGRTAYHKLGTVDDNFPAVEIVLEEVEKALRSDVEFDYLTFSGNGEPSLHPEFDILAQECKKLLKRIRPDVRLTLLSNSSTCTDEKLVKALEYVDLPIMKLDAGNSTLFKKINNPVDDIDFNEMIYGLSQLNEVTIQCLFLGGNPDNSQEDALNDWYSCLDKIKPVDIQIYTLDRPFARQTANGPVKINKVSDDKMDRIVETVRSRFGFEISRY